MLFFDAHASLLPCAAAPFPVGWSAADESSSASLQIVVEHLVYSDRPCFLAGYCPSSLLSPHLTVFKISFLVIHLDNLPGDVKTVAVLMLKKRGRNLIRHQDEEVSDL